jgi:uncharacterized protein
MPVTTPISGAEGASAERLSADRCRALLARSSFGHLALSQGALPLVVPVTYALDGERLLVRAGLFLIAKDPVPGVVAFGTGGTTRGDGATWEVLVQGRAEVTDEVQAPKSPPQFPLIDGTLTTVLRVSMERLTGWQFGRNAGMLGSSPGGQTAGLLT